MLDKSRVTVRADAHTVEGTETRAESITFLMYLVTIANYILEHVTVATIASIKLYLDTAFGMQGSSL